MNIATLHERFCQEVRILKNHSPATVKWYRQIMKQFLRFHHVKITQVKEITTEKLREYLYHGRLERDWTADTFLYHYKGLRAFFKWCVNNDVIETNPILKIEKPKLEKKLPKRISREEALRILEYSFNMKTIYRFARYRNRAIFAVMIYAGLRATETVKLKLGDVDISQQIISIRNGKGGKDRIVPISPSLSIYLSEYLKERNRLKRDCEFFFVSTHQDIPFTYNGLKKVVDLIRKKTKISFSCHRLRHTFATLLIESGCDIFSLSKMLGHSNIKTTTIYLSASVEHLQQQIMKHPLN